MESKRLMGTPLVYDGRNIYDVEMEKAEVEYHSVGRQAVTRESIRESKNIAFQAVRS